MSSPFATINVPLANEVPTGHTPVSIHVSLTPPHAQALRRVFDAVRRNPAYTFNGGRQVHEPGDVVKLLLDLVPPVS